MSAGGLSATSLATLANDGSSVALRWLDMVPPTPSPIPANTDGSGAGATTGTFAVKVIKETNDFVGLIKDPMNFISIMGPARSGKSTLMNLLAGCTQTELFPSYPGMSTFTKGVYVPTRLLSLPEFSALEGEPTVNASSTNIKVSFIDTEGQGAVGTGYDMDLFSPALICSRVVMYNRTGGLLTEEILSQLGMMTQAAQRLHISGDVKPTPTPASGDVPNGTGPAIVNGTPTTRASSSAAGPANGTASSDTPGNSAASFEAKGPSFGHLLIIFNQYRLNPQDNAESLQRKLMTEEASTDNAAINRNNIRKLLLTVFESVKVYILPDKLKVEARDGLADGSKKFILLSDFEPKYLEYFKILRNGLSQALIKPRELLQNTPLTGGSAADFVPSFADAINKAVPLNIPNIFEAAQNDAINKALVAFDQGLSANADGLVKEEAKPTSMLSTIFDQDVNLLLGKLAMTLSYMTTEIIQKAQADAKISAKATKETLLATNLEKLKALLSISLNKTVTNINGEFNGAFPETGLLVTQAVVDDKAAELKSNTIASFKMAGEGYDSRALPQDYVQVLETAFASKKEALLARIANAWASWATTASYAQAQKLSDGLQKLGKDTAVGDTTKYTSSQADLLSAAILEYDQKIDTEFHGLDGEIRKKNFEAYADSLCKTSRAVWEKNDADVQTQLKGLINRLESRYQIQLQDSLTPHVEPAPYAQITNASIFKDQLSSFLKINNVSSQVGDQQTLDFDLFISSQKSSFNATYTTAIAAYQTYLLERTQEEDQRLIQAATEEQKHEQEIFEPVMHPCTAFGIYIQNELERNIPLYIQSYIEALDLIDLDFSHNARTRIDVEVNCNTNADIYRVKLKSLEQSFNVQPHGVVSSSILATAENDFEMRLKQGKEEKLNKYDEVVSVFNKALLTIVTFDVINKSLANTYPSTTPLDTDVEDARQKFFARSRGDGTDATTKWNNFKITIYKALVETVQRFNAYQTPGLDGTKAITPEIQNAIIMRVNDTIRDMAQELGMSWIGGDSTFQLEDMGLSKIDPNDPDKPTSHDWRMKNTGNYNGFDSDRKTNLEYFDWTTEISDIIWGKPILTDLKPTRIDTSEYPSMPQSYTITVGTTSNDATTITDSYTWGVGAKLGLKSGDPKIGVEVAAEFSGTYSGTKTNTVTTTCTTSTTATLVMPAHRANMVNQMIFSQRTSLPYTARVKLVPRLRFTNGFTRWKTYYIKNPNGDRTYGDQTMGRLDELKQNARDDADPWKWHDCIRDHPDMQDRVNWLADGAHYEVFVKGKWEGVTGKYAVTTVTPKNTFLTLLPTDD